MTNITRTTETLYAVKLGDRHDDAMRLDGAILRPADMTGFIRIEPSFRMTLGPISYARVIALSIGETIVLPQTGPVVAEKGKL